MPVEEIPIEKLFIGSTNVRKNVGDITELMDSIESKGLLHPLVVRKVDDKYEVVCGSRRFHAIKALGWKTVPCDVRELSDSEAMVLSLVENLQRGDLNLEEKVTAYLKIMSLENLKTHEELSEYTTIPRQTISQDLQAYEALKILKPHGITVGKSSTPTVGKTQEVMVEVPKTHAIMVEGAFKHKDVKEKFTELKLSKEKIEEKYVELVKEIKDLPRYQARKVVNHFKKFPEKDIEIIKEEALARYSGIMLQVYFRPKVARALEEAALERALEPEELVPEIVTQWLKKEGYMK